jgi:hypothetical protein
MSTHFGLSALVISTLLISSIGSAMADSKEEALLPIERKISTFSIRVTKAGYAHFSSTDKAPVGSLPAKIIAIDGRNSNDIWMLTETGVVLQDDGKAIKFRQAKPCGYGNYEGEFGGLGLHLDSIVVDENEVHVFGQYRGMNSRVGAERRATLARNGKWTCSEKGITPAFTQSSGAFSWRAANNMEGDACRIGSLSGYCNSGPRFAPTHIDPSRDSTDMGILNMAMWMQAPDDGWIVTLDELFQPVLYRFNGVTWAKQTKFDDGARVYSMWVDDQHQVWMTAGAIEPWNAPAKMILRYDGKNLTELPTPKSFTTSRVRGHSSRDVWFSGVGNTIYQWDGSRLRQGKLAGDVSDMWVSSDDVAFFVLPDAIAFAAPSGEKH